MSDEDDGVLKYDTRRVTSGYLLLFTSVGKVFAIFRH
jgi:hypothetical protein